MKHSNPFSGFILSVMGLVMLTSGLQAQSAARVEPAFVGETLYYQVFYRGLFSAFSRIPVANAMLSTQRYQAPGLSSPLLDTALTVSTAGYDFVEGLYPFRYRMRTLYQLSPQGSVAFERIKRTRKSKYDLVWVDREPGVQQAIIKRYRRGDTPVDSVLPTPVAQWADTKAISVHPKTRQPDGKNNVATDVLDWLSLLQAIRGLSELPSENVLLPVTDGNGQRNYRVSREGRETLVIGDRSWPAWRYSLIKMSDNGEDENNPIKVWLSTDERHLPLRLQTSHTVGRFIIEYRQSPIVQPISVDTPIQVAEVEDDY